MVLRGKLEGYMPISHLVVSLSILNYSHDKQWLQRSMQNSKKVPPNWLTSDSKCYLSVHMTARFIHNGF